MTVPPVEELRTCTEEDIALGNLDLGICQKEIEVFRSMLFDDLVFENILGLCVAMAVIAIVFSFGHITGKIGD